MTDLTQLYQDVILDHYRKPRNFGVLGVPRKEAAGHNPLCGDKVKVFVRTEGGQIEDVAFEGAGCAISTASASLMTEAVKGKSVAEAKDLFEHFVRMVRGEEEVGTHDLGKLDALAGVKELPVRIKCATLAWHTLQAALDEKDQEISTE